MLFVFKILLRNSSKLSRRTSHCGICVTLSLVQIQLQQLRDKVQDTAEKIAGKRSDIDSNKEQLSEIKQQLTELIDNCETLYGEYDVQRSQVIELKNNRRNEAANASWGDEDTSWGAATTTIDSTNAKSVVPSIPGYAQYRALYAFVGRNADEISFEPGEIIMVIFHFFFVFLEWSKADHFFLCSGAI